MKKALREDLDRLFHGERLTSDVAQQITNALRASHRFRRAGRTGSITQISSLASSLPSVQELYKKPKILATLHAWIAVSDPSLFMSSLLQYLLCARSLIQLSSFKDQTKKWLDELDSGHAKGVYLITEIGESSSHIKVQTEARYDETRREFVLSTPNRKATKFSSVHPRGGPQIAVAFARLIHKNKDRGVFGFVVPLTDAHGPMPGVEISDAISVPALPLGYAMVRFKDVHVPYADWLASEASIDQETGTFHDPDDMSKDARLAHSMSAGNAIFGIIPSAMAAVARSSATTALKYSSRRKSNSRLKPGVPVISYRPQQVALLGSLAESMALSCAARSAEDLWETTLDNKASVTKGNMTFVPWLGINQVLSVYKVLSTEGALRVTRNCQQHEGLHGMLEANRIASHHGLAQAFTVAGGDNRLTFLDIGRTKVDSEPGPPPPAPDVSPYDPRWWPATTLLHEHLRCEQVRAALKKRQRGDLDQLTVWNPLLDDAIALGRAHTDNLTARCFYQALDNIVTPDLSSVMRKLAALYGVVQAKRLSGELLAAGAIEVQTVRALSSYADTLCEQLMSHLPVLCELSGLPDELTMSPATAKDYATALTSKYPWIAGGLP